MRKINIYGHVLAASTIIIWGTTFVSTKILLIYLTPEEILLFRFLLAFLILIIFYPKRIKIVSLKEEIIFAILGLSGISLYFWLENIALKFTYASNVGLIMSSIPIFTAVIAHRSTKDEKFSFLLLLGFIIAMTGIFIIIYNGRILKLNLKGDFLALIAAILFSVYSVIIKKVNQEYPMLLITKKIFFYGILTIVPIALTTDISFSKLYKYDLTVYGNLIFLALFASVLCFVMWNKSINIIGSVKATHYIYFVPLITMATSVIFINEKITGLMIFGGILIFLGVYISNGRLSIKEQIFSNHKQVDRHL